MILHFAKRLWEMPPREAFHKLGRRLSGRKDAFDLEELLNSSKHMRTQKFYDFFSRYEAILTQANGWQPIEFDDRRVLEMGCGPLLGFGPLAIFRGAKEFIAVEPEFEPMVLEDQRVVDNYFWNVFGDLSALYGPRMDFDEFMVRLRGLTNIFREEIRHVALNEKIDVILTNSCLEHISPFQKSMDELHKNCSAEVRFIHLVDFGNHRPTASPFDEIYAVDRDKFLQENGLGINLLRAPDILAALEKSGFNVSFVPYGHGKKSWRVSAEKSWTDKYSQDELFTKTAIFYSK